MLLIDLLEFIVKIVLAAGLMVLKILVAMGLSMLTIICHKRLHEFLRKRYPRGVRNKALKFHLDVGYWIHSYAFLVFLGVKVIANVTIWIS